MTDYIFLFDLDSTITRREVLPTIAEKIFKLDEMRTLTEATMKGDLPFKTSFLKRVNILSTIDVSEVRTIIREIPLNNSIVEFIKANSGRCYIVTGNLDIWICDLMKDLGISHHVYCSRAEVENDKIIQVTSVLDKELMAKQFVRPLVVIGDGDNDSGMARVAEISVGFGGVREIAPSLLRSIDFAFYEDNRCADFLWKLL